MACPGATAGSRGNPCYHRPALYGGIIAVLGDQAGLPVVFWFMAISFVLAALAIVPIREPARAVRDPQIVGPD